MFTFWNSVSRSIQNKLSLLLSFNVSSNKLNYHQSWSNMPNNQVLNHRVRPITVSVDGNISSGKSTLVSSLKELFPNDFQIQVELVPEPLEKWTDLQGHNLLGMFYEDPVKHNFMFQHYVQLTRLMETIKKPPVNESKRNQGNHNGTVRIMERSLQNNMHCFTELARREGNLQPEEFAVLSEWHHWLEENFDLHLDLLIYLRTTPEIVYDRMQKRGRKEESTVPLGYLKRLHETYEDWLVRGKIQNSHRGRSNGIPGKDAATGQKVLVIDATKGKEEVAKECSDLLRVFMNEIGYSATSEKKI